MQIQKLQSNQPSFGTKVRMSSKLKELYSVRDGGAALQKYISVLEMNKKNDILSISYQQDKSLTERILVDVFMKKNKKVYTGTTLVLFMPKDKKPTCLNLIELYNKVSEQMYKLKK